jgi:hypothetical protein
MEYWTITPIEQGVPDAESKECHREAAKSAKIDAK